MHHILHIITGLGTGGAEMVLHRLLSRLDRRRFSAEVIGLIHDGPVGEKIRADGHRVTALEMRRDDLTSLNPRRLVSTIRRVRPDLIQTWCYHADLLGGLAGRLAGVRPIAWGLHHTTLHPRHSHVTTRLIARACAPLSALVPQRIVCCSEASRSHHASIGYAPDKLVLIRNGIDVSAFRPDPSARPALCALLGLPAGSLLVGHAGRFDPQKDHRTLLQAAGRVLRALPDAHFVLCGGEITQDNPTLVGWAREAGIDPRRLHLLGRRDDMPRVMAGLDLLVLSSAFGEACPLVLCEAMASGVPCVTTDVGDSVAIVGETGRGVPASAPDALAAAVLAMLEMPAEARSALGVAARARIEARFDLSVMVDAYQTLWEGMLSERP